MILSDTAIQDAISSKDFEIFPEVDSARLQPNGIDLTLGSQFKRYVNEDCLVQGVPYEMETFMVNDYYEILPHEFILGTTHEYVGLISGLAGLLNGKSTLARMGLIVHVVAGFIDTGFRGRITLELYNVNSRPIRIYPGKPIAQLILCRVEGAISRSYGTRGLNSHYQNQITVTGPK
jgi:dCTP deaminase